jgi:hypothetical protein
MKKTIYLLFIIIFAVMLSGCTANQDDSIVDDAMDAELDENTEDVQENEDVENDIGITESDLEKLKSNINEMDVEDLPSFTE